MSKLPFEQLGPYRIIRALGSGGMGSVYLGIDDQTSMQAAVKVLSPALAANESFRLRFGTEIETLKKLKHPNIVQLLGFGEQDGQLFYVMEYVEGRTLHEELRAGRRFTWREVARLGVEICQALKHAHDRGVIHRDLKPANLIYTTDEHVKLLDFGIAKLYGMTQLTIAGGVLGTVDFMAPEQADGSGISARSDLYSLGAVLYTLLCSRPPFMARTVPEMLHKLRYDDAPSVRNLAPETPEEFELIVNQLLQKDPQQRIATPLAVANRLKAMEFALSVETRVEPLPETPDADADYQLAPDANDRPTLDSLNAPIDDDATTLATGPPGDSLHPHRRSTMAMSELYEPDDGLTPSAEEAARTTHFTTYDEAARQREQRSSDADDGIAFWLKILPPLLAIVLISLGIWYFTRPPTADGLYERISAAAEQDDAPRALASIQTELDRFLELYPQDPRCDEVQSWQEDASLYRLQKKYEFRARLRGGAESLSPVEKAYLSAMRLAASDPGSAARKLQALLDVYTDTELDRSAAECLKLAGDQLEKLLQRQAALATGQTEQLAQRLDAADQLDSTDPARANAIRRGIIELYGSELWAESLVARARKALQD